MEEVQARLFTDPRYAVLGADKAARENAVLRGGLKIYATLDPRAQANAQAAVDDTVTQESFSAAVVAMDPTSGAVRAMVGGKGGFDTSQFNIATDGIGRQPGSTWKVITLATAMQNHYSANDQVSGSSPCDFGPSLGKTQNAEGGEGVDDPPGRHRRFGQLRVREPRALAGLHQGHRHGEEARDHPEHAAALPDPDARHHRSHSARDGHGGVDHCGHG